MDYPVFHIEYPCFTPIAPRSKCLPRCTHCPADRGRCIGRENCLCHQPNYVRNNATGTCEPRCWTNSECAADVLHSVCDTVGGLCECAPGYSWRAESRECLPVCDFCDEQADECVVNGTTRCTCWDSYEEREEVTKGESSEM